MARKRSKRPIVAAEPFKPTSPQERMKLVAEDMARTTVEATPHVKHMRDAITRAVMGAAKKAAGQSVRKGRFA